MFIFLAVTSFGPEQGDAAMAAVALHGAELNQLHANFSLPPHAKLQQSVAQHIILIYFFFNEHNTVNLYKKNGG